MFHRNYIFALLKYITYAYMNIHQIIITHCHSMILFVLVINNKFHTEADLIYFLRLNVTFLLSINFFKYLSLTTKILNKI